jgi:hypothetical protein
LAAAAESRANQSSLCLLLQNPARLPRVKLAPPPAEHVIEISSDSDVSKSTEGSVSSVRKQSRKKVITTFTSVLSARSKVGHLSLKTLLCSSTMNRN